MRLVHKPVSVARSSHSGRRSGVKFRKYDKVSDLIICDADRNHAMPDACSWMQVLARYGEPSTMRSVFELVITVGWLDVLWMAALEPLHKLLEWHRTRRTDREHSRA